MAAIEYEITTVAVFDDTVPVASNCNCISFFNQGTSLLYVGAMQVLPQREWTPFQGSAEEKDVTNYNIRFDTSNGGTVKLCVVARKTYKSYVS